jgi:outer membrane protein OmpA-like peptidoglycan-associated protein
MIRIGLVLTCLLGFVGIESARAQSSDDIINALDPTQRILPNPAFRKPVFVDPTSQGITDPKNKGVKIEGETEDAPVSIDLHIPFEYNSDKLTPDAILILRRLGTALTNPRLATYRFKLAGHTDAKGTVEYNQKLSERRSIAVRDYLIFQYDVQADRIEAVGLGKTQLADPSRPEDGVNRRVQVINVGPKQKDGTQR